MVSNCKAAGLQHRDCRQGRPCISSACLLRSRQVMSLCSSASSVHKSAGVPSDKAMTNMIFMNAGYAAAQQVSKCLLAATDGNDPNLQQTHNCILSLPLLSETACRA